MKLVLAHGDPTLSTHRTCLFLGQKCVCSGITQLLGGVATGPPMAALECL